MINEVLQWVAIALLATPKIVQIVRDFTEQEEDE